MKVKLNMCSKEINDYWNPYLCKLSEDEYSIEESVIEEGVLTLSSPFINATYNLPIEKLNTLNYVNSALSRRKSFEIGFNSSSIDDVEYALCYVEKNYRLMYLKNEFIDTKLSEKFTDDDIWSLLIEVWSESEFNCWSATSRDLWHEIFMRRPRPMLLIQSLPHTFDVYRGGSKEGFSWTRDIEVARWFQNRTDSIGVKSYLLKATVHRDDVLFTRDSESEIVVDPDSLVSMWRMGGIKTLDYGNT